MLQISYAEPILILNYVIYIDDSIEIVDIKYSNGTVFYTPGTEEYQLFIRGEGNNTLVALTIPVVFYKFEVGEVNYSRAYHRIPWNDEYRTIRFLHNDTVIKEVELSGYICNENNICESDRGESELICPKECVSITTTTTIIKPGNMKTLIIFSIVGIVSAVVIYVWRLKKKDDKFTKLKEKYRRY